jgi:ribosomal protein S18 acetylase RimI-like enzyme
MIEIITDINQTFREDIRQLYLSTFSKGENAQWIDEKQLDESLNNTYQSGFMFVGLLSGKPVAALFVVPLCYDSYCPDILSQQFDTENSAYIAELMVDEQHRGLGFGGIILQKSIHMLKQKAFSDVFIRVWEKNEKALQLYLKTGFVIIAGIMQQKKLPDGINTLEMNKVYLHKKL